MHRLPIIAETQVRQAGPFRLSHLAPGSRIGQRGFALMVALSFLALVTILAITFFASMQIEYGTAKAYGSEVKSKFLIDTSMNMVMGQIITATQGSPTTGTARLTWASQPGMIRTYDDTGAAGTCFKLYSSGAMTVPSKDILSTLAADVPVGWNTQTALYTDLNSPVMDSTGALQFPILDGNLNLATINGQQVLTYASDGASTPDIEGFSIPLASVPTYNSASPISSANNPAPMPVQWLYILKDGSITSPSSGSGTQVTWATNRSDAPTPSNPIVGRVAFWTDDETSKLNINTASEGIAYGAVHTNTATDMGNFSLGKAYGYAMTAPATGEYNRYPGHPATTCLSVALGKWVGGLNTLNAPTAFSSTIDDNTYLLGLQGYLQLPSVGGTLPQAVSPRYGFGGSQAGTIPVVNRAYSAGYEIYSPNASYVPPVNPSGRLYSSVDELIFDPSRTAFTGLDKATVEKLRFFLTASSRAPELTPFNTPKVSIWPQRADANERSNPKILNFLNNQNGTAVWSLPSAMKVSEGLLAFCSEIGSSTTSVSGKNEYFFQRSVTPGCRSSTADWLNVPRNPQLVNYLYNMGNRNIPGYGATFVSDAKYNSKDFSQILVETFDYVRSSVSAMEYFVYNSYTDNTSSPYISPIVVSGNLPGASASSPLRGFGFFPICTQAAFGITLDTSATSPSPRIFLAFQAFYPMLSNPGFLDPRPVLNVQVTGLSNMQIPLKKTATPTAPDISPDLPSETPLNLPKGYNNPSSDWIDNGDSPLRLRTWCLDNPVGGTGLTGAGPFCEWDNLAYGAGSSIPITFNGPMTFNILNDNSEVIQTMNVTFPSVVVPTPTTGAPNATNQNSKRSKYLFQNDAVVRSVLPDPSGPYKGDVRLLVCTDPSSNVATSLPAVLTQALEYSKTIPKVPSQAHALIVLPGQKTQNSNLLGTNPQTLTPTTTSTGSLIAELNSTDYEDASAPIVPPGLLGAFNYLNKPGDWDTGSGTSGDGPWIHPLGELQVNGTAQYFELGYNQQNQIGQSLNASSLSPNRIVASPICFGSLPTGVYQSPPQPWQTLRFCPNPAARMSASSDVPGATQEGEHIGFVNPPDHLYLEFFTMPTVEPYAISEPLSTAGKVNLNYQMAPFTNIERSTALRGVLKNVTFKAISGYDIKRDPTNPTSNPAYKYNYITYGVRTVPVNAPHAVDYQLNRDLTLQGIQQNYFNRGNVFRYPSEICDVFLAPQAIPGATYNPKNASLPTTYDGINAWWNTRNLANMIGTGKNVREEPYDAIYPRLCTKSNTYTVHYRVQTLQKRKDTNVAVWDEGKDLVSSEYRGSSLIERYIDPNNPALNPAWDTDTMNLALSKANVDLSKLYQFRVISVKRFDP